MKQYIVIIITLLLAKTAVSAEPDSSYHLPLSDKWEFRWIGTENLYPTYHADPLAVRFEVSSQNILFADYDHEDIINKSGEYLGKLNIIPGVRLSLLKFTPKNKPNLGIEFDLGFSIPVMMRAGNNDLIGTEGIYYFAIAGKPAEWLSLRFMKHHICTHLGDEFSNGDIKSPIDFDLNQTQLPVRDDFILSAAVRPLHFLNRPNLDILQIYGDFGFFLPGKDFMGTRQNKPHREAYLNFQGGIEVEHYFKNKHFGGVFTAGNVSAYQLNAFSPNISLRTGYIFPQDIKKNRLSIGLHYYNGRSLNNQFYNRKEKFLAFFVMTDI